MNNDIVAIHGIELREVEVSRRPARVRVGSTIELGTTSELRFGR